jgi:ribosomal protein S18 acetylase RimI-like enzyme
MRILTRWPSNYDKAVAEALARALSKPAQADEVLRAYRRDDLQTLFVAFDNGEVTGCIGIRQVEDRVVVQHVWVNGESRRHGIARRLLTEVLVRHPSALEAESGDDAVSLYRRLGFTVTPVRSAVPGARYRCTLPAPASRFTRGIGERLKVANW